MHTSSLVTVLLGLAFLVAHVSGAGPAGPAGLELAYDLGNRWEVAAGGAWRVYRFRLDDNGPVPGGVGEVKSVPLFVRLSNQFAKSVKLDIYAGANVGSQLRVENAAGGTIGSDNRKTSALLGLTVSRQF